MKKSLLLLAGGLLAANFAVSAQAADEDKSGPMEKMGTGMHKMMGTMGSHKMTGTVEKIDHTKGMLTLKTGEGDLVLHFPPPDIKDLNNGDTITVKLSYSKEKPPKK